MYKRNIQRLTQTYLTLSLQDIANSVQLKSSKEAEMHVLQMVCMEPYSCFFMPVVEAQEMRNHGDFISSQIQDGEIYATINQKDGMVRFLEDPEQYKTCQMIEHIDSSIQRLVLKLFCCQFINVEVIYCLSSMQSVCF